MIFIKRIVGSGVSIKRRMLADFIIAVSLIHFIFSHDYEGFDKLYIAIGSIISSLLIAVLNVESMPSNIALVLFVWVIINSLVRIKKCKFVNDDNKKMGTLRFVALVLFILLGLLTVINLYNLTHFQIIIIGFYCFMNGAIDLFVPIAENLTNN